MSILDQIISIGYSTEGARAYKWKTMTSTVQELIDFLSDHKEGKKDGMSILQGTVISSTARKVSDRKATAVDQLSLCILDIDTGDSIDRIERKCNELGLFAIVHTTFSNNSTTTKIKKDKVLTWAESESDLGEDQIIDYMREVKRINPTILKTMKVQGTTQDNDGIQIVIEHAPMPKLRVIFVLKEKFVIADRGGSQKKAIEEWKERYIGVARQINATIDRACVDPSRLMYTPRHPPGRDDYDFRVIYGEALDLEQIPRISLKGEEVENQWLAEGISERKEYKTDGLMKFVAQHSDHFDVVELCRDLFDVRRDDGQKVSVPCPNDDAHSDAGNPDDIGFFAGVGDQGNFIMKCMHDSCSHLDRVDFLDLICQDASFTTDDLLPYVAEIVGEEDVIQKEAEPWKTADEILAWLKDPDTVIDDHRLEAFADAVAVTNPTGLQLEQISTLAFQKSNRAAKASVIKKTIQEKIKGEEKEDTLHEFPEEVVNRLEQEKEKFAVVLVKGDLCVLKRNNKAIIGLDEPYEIMSVDTYKQLRCNENIFIRGGDKINVGKSFMEWGARKTYDDGLVFEPPPGRPHGRVFNHWDGFKFEPEEGDWSVIRDHIYEVLCRGNDEYFEFMMTWIAHMFQRPGEKAGSAIVVRGKKGTGKSIIFDKFMNKLLKQYAMTISNGKQIVGQFNAHLFGKLFVCLEEAVWAGDASGEGVLKSLITGENLTYEFKGMTPFKATNYTRVVFLSNEDWVVPATYDERRFFITEPLDGRIRDKAYFKRLADAVNDPVVQSAFLYDMLYTEVEDWDILRFPPRTEWLDEQVSISMTPEEQFFIEMIQAHGTRSYGKEDQIDPIYLDEEETTEVNSDDMYAHYKLAISGMGTAIIRRGRPFPSFEKKVLKFFGVPIDKKAFAGDRIETIAVPPIKLVRARLTKEGYVI